jgi:DNA-directed RNA polymerase beta' subunit
VRWGEKKVPLCHLGLHGAFFTVEQAQNVVGERPVSGEAKDAGQLPAINRLP